VNTADNPATGMNYRISSVPTFLAFRDGAVVGQVVGFRARELRGLVEQILAGDA
jgi:thioredoxin-like negative regulator of GroEL